VSLTSHRMRLCDEQGRQGRHAAHRSFDTLVERSRAELFYRDLPTTCPEVVTVDPLDGRPLIPLRKWDSPARQKFSLAHALGHVELHIGRALNGIDPDRPDTVPPRGGWRQKPTPMPPPS
jgi:hypothetical protein